jgi:hypothetical protein
VGILDLSNVAVIDVAFGPCEGKGSSEQSIYRVDGLVLVGDTAVITVSGYCYGTWFTDHLSMIKIERMWRIVTKTFYAHPSG